MKKLSYPLTKNPFLNDDLKEGIKVIKSKHFGEMLFGAGR